MRNQLLCISGAVAATASYAPIMESLRVLNEIKTAQTSFQPAGTAKWASIDQPFDFRLGCNNTYVTSEQCTKAKAALDRIGKRIGQVLDISKQIVVNVSYWSFNAFCLELENRTSTDCAQEKVKAGYAYSAANALAQREGEPQPYYYPNCLFKQILPDAANFLPDIYSYFNADHPFYFADDKVSIGPNQTDFELAVAHELLHAFGLHSSFVPIYSYVKRTTAAQPYLTVQLTHMYNENKKLPELGFSKLFPFDAYLFSGDENLALLGKTVLNFKDRFAEENQFYDAFEKSGEPFNAAVKIRTLAQSGNLQFKASGANLKLYSPAVYEYGVSMEHLDPSLFDTPDFILTPSYNQTMGQTVDELITKHKSGKIYGNGVISMLAAIGWPIQGNPARISLKHASWEASMTISKMAIALVLLVVAI